MTNMVMMAQVHIHQPQCPQPQQGVVRRAFKLNKDPLTIQKFMNGER